MTRYAWLTHDALPSETARRVDVPDDDDFLADLLGALHLLSLESNHEQSGTLTPSETADYWRDYLYRFVQAGGVMGHVTLVYSLPNATYPVNLPVNAWSVIPINQQDVTRSWCDLYAPGFFVLEPGTYRFTYSGAVGYGVSSLRLSDANGYRWQMVNSKGTGFLRTSDTAVIDVPASSGGGYPDNARWIEIRAQSGGYLAERLAYGQDEIYSRLLIEQI